MSVFSERLRSLMEERGLSQIRLCERTGIPKSAMNQYLNDRFKPKRDRTYVICRELDVNPAWLMGLTDKRSTFAENGLSDGLSDEELSLIEAYRAYPEVRATLWEHIMLAKAGQHVFRAAKSSDGTVAPSRETMTPERIDALLHAPETDEDL